MISRLKMSQLGYHSPQYADSLLGLSVYYALVLAVIVVMYEYQFIIDMF
jgi:hypothetical protein